MTVLSPTQIVGMALPSVAPSSSGPIGGSNIGTYAGTDWQYQRDAKTVRTQKERRATLAKAREKVNARAETKQERRARETSARETGSEKERAATRGSVAKAAEKVASVPLDTEVNTDDFRKVCHILRSRYPGRKLSAMLETAQQQERQFLEDPVQARENLIAQYAKLPSENLPVYKDPKYSSGLRGSLQRARQDQDDLEDLKDWVAKFGKHLPTILQQIEAFDRGMLTDPALTSARLAAAYGAPSVPSEVPAYQAKQAAKVQQRAIEQAFHDRCKGVHLAIEGGHLPGINVGDVDALEELAAVLQDPKFQHHPTNGLDSLQRAAAIATHPDYKRITQRKGGKSNRHWAAGQKSISGAPGPGQGGNSANRGRGTGGIRDSIARVREAM